MLFSENKDEIAKSRVAVIEGLVSLLLLVISHFSFPQKKTKEELHREAKSLVKNAWKDSGNGGELF